MKHWKELSKKEKANRVIDIIIITLVGLTIAVWLISCIGAMGKVKERETAYAEETSFNIPNISSGNTAPTAYVYVRTTVAAGDGSQGAFPFTIRLGRVAAATPENNPVSITNSEGYNGKIILWSSVKIALTQTEQPLSSNTYPDETNYMSAWIFNAKVVWGRYVNGNKDLAASMDYYGLSWDELRSKNFGTVNQYYVQWIFIEMQYTGENIAEATDSSYEAGYQSGFYEGYNYGEEQGMKQGFDNGYSEALRDTDTKNISLKWLVQFANTLMSTNILGNFSMGDLVFTMLAIAVFGGILKLFFGG
ncbi:MAG: hypothetical protein J1F17_06905 [Oscillospiraceae bacterium]|nr:hypothetical protein [Oscillospiraceae bacterium]